MRHGKMINSPIPKADALLPIDCTPNMLYELEPERVITEGILSINDLLLWGHGFNHIPEIEVDNYMFSSSFSETDKIEVRIYKDFNFDHRRFWRLASVWYEGKPVMIIRNAGREGDDHSSRFVTDSAQYYKMIYHILTLRVFDVEETYNDTVDPDTVVPKLLEFYENSLFGWFERF